jgi:hypothetical protein
VSVGLSSCQAADQKCSPSPRLLTERSSLTLSGTVCSRISRSQNLTFMQRACPARLHYPITRTEGPACGPAGSHPGRFTCFRNSFQFRKPLKSCSLAGFPLAKISSSPCGRATVISAKRVGLSCSHLQIWVRLFSFVSRQARPLSTGAVTRTEAGRRPNLGSFVQSHVAASEAASTAWCRHPLQGPVVWQFGFVRSVFVSRPAYGAA